ncbi:MAG: T9SS type A sorting domain-containing protein [Flavobacteriia bacterium]|nr:T9SS type A sorting domain-containing protein [Flavobacteriia bacterium]OJX39785.1 MAG: hypothetical protein BGO87_02175 [Flavobacteriia bacterium 40-80]
MKKSILFLLLFLSTFLSAQEEFSFQLYFEDAAGTKDTITLGYDPLATDGIDATFGEANILNQPWGDSLDVRIGDLTYQAYPLEWLSNNSYLTKKQILTLLCDEESIEVNSSSVSLQFKIQNLPIKISWNYDLFGNTCRWKSSFYGNIYGSGWYGPGILLGSNNGDYLLNYNNVNNNDPAPFMIINEDQNYLWKLIQAYETNGDTIAVLQFAFWGSKSNGINTNTFPIMSISPNPSTDLMTIDLSDNWNNEPYELTIYQLDGTLMKKQALSSNINTISVNELNRGIYFFTLTDNAGTTVTQKIMKN